MFSLSYWKSTLYFKLESFILDLIPDNVMKKVIMPEWASEPFCLESEDEGFIKIDAPFFKSNK